MKDLDKFKRVYIALLCFAVLLSCKKDKLPGEDSDEVISPTTGTRMQFTLDSIFLYARQVYLWNEALPGYSAFAPRERYAGIDPDLMAFRKELFDISQFKINTETGNPFELSVYSDTPKYSYLEPGNSTGGAKAGNDGSSSPVLESKLITSGYKIIAYVALASFPALSSSQAVLDQTFATLAGAKPKYMVIDLRSNNGGYVETAEHVANLLAPASLNGKVMYTEQFNAKMQAGAAKILKHQPYLDANGKPVIYKNRNATMADVDYTEAGNTYRFNKKGSLTTVQDIYFIVSGKTASASELLISCLKPYFDVKLVGEKTYGKPVGFFAINIDKYSVYLSSFLIKNALGWSNYFLGMSPDIAVVGATKPELGNPEERCLKATIDAINGIKIKSKALAPGNKLMSAKAPFKIAEKELSEGFYMQETRLRLHK